MTAESGITESNLVKTWFERKRQPGDLVFSIAFLILSLFLLSRLGAETQWVTGARLFSQPGFWPAISLAGMSMFAILHSIGSVMSLRIPGRWQEVVLWVRSLEYALWFMAYVWLVPRIGYLAASVLFTLSLTFRIGYRSRLSFLAAGLIGFFTVLVFKSLLSVRIPGGLIYEYLPDGLRNFMLIYF